LISGRRIGYPALVGLLCLLVPSAASAAVRYAAPAGSGTACTQASPCGIQVAVEAPAVADGDEVILAPGTYGVGNDPVVASKAIYLHGAAGSRPLINSNSGFALVLGAFGRLVDVEVRTTAPGVGLVVGRGALTQRVISIEQAPSGGIGCFLAADPSSPPELEESACIANGTNGTALQSGLGVSPGVNGLARTEDVTAVATGPTSTGVKSTASGNGGSVTLSGTNVIASGTGADVIADGGSGGSIAFAQFDHSDYDSQQEIANAAVTDPGFGSNVTGPALLVDPASGDVHEQPGSATIDHGALVGSGPDLDGDLRPQGPPDIGADEYALLSEVPMCFGRPATIKAPPSGPILGTSGPDVILGTPGPDTIRSGGGKDLICSLGGRDVVRAGGGPDKVRGSGDPDKLYGAGGRDLLFGGPGRDRIRGGSGKDTILGGGGHDIVVGGVGADHCEAAKRDRTLSCE
jgi:hypothetical protein